MTQGDPALERARKHVKNLSDFHYHLMTYVLVCAFLVVIDRRTDGGAGVLGLDWAYWVIIFWGFGVWGHGVSVYFGEHRVHKVYAREKRRDAGRD